MDSEIKSVVSPDELLAIFVDLNGLDRAVEVTEMVLLYLSKRKPLHTILLVDHSALKVLKCHSDRQSFGSSAPSSEQKCWLLESMPHGGA